MVKQRSESIDIYKKNNRSDLLEVEQNEYNILIIKGPNLNLSSGTTTSISVIVEERAPISYVIPLLRNMSGIY